MKNEEQKYQHIQSLERIIQRLNDYYNTYDLVNMYNISSKFEVCSDALNHIKAEYIKIFYPSYYD